MSAMTIGGYLIKRLEQAGVRHIFGVPGDYVLGFFEYLEKSGIEVVGTCNELNAGYAADGYARVNGVGAVCVTYGVGGFSLLNAIVGAHAERVPVIVVSGGPELSARRAQHLLHHTIGDMNLQYDSYAKITVASVIVTDPELAPRQIDETIAACLRSRRPVYIEIPVDIVSEPCRDPGPFHADSAIISHRGTLEEALEEADAMLRSAKKPVIFAGVEAHRLRIQRELEELVTHAGYPFATTLLGKAVLPERHPQFAGVYNGAVGSDFARRVVEEADVLLSLGALMTDMNLGIWSARLETSKMIVANSDKVRIKHHVYEDVGLEDFINGLRLRLPKGGFEPATFTHPSEVMLKADFVPEPGRKISQSRFFQRINRFIEGNTIILADTGDSILAAADLYLPKGIEFIGQAFYLSIGYSVPATLGVKLAAPQRRPIVFVGDGAFQMTAQELSTIIRHGLNPIIFLMNNEGYTIERVLHDGPFNDLQNWKYHLLPGVFGGGWGCEVRTEGDLEIALKRVQDEPDSLAFIEVRLDRRDFSENLRRLGEIIHKKSAPETTAFDRGDLTQ